MARALYLVDVLRAAGLVVIPSRDWETRGGSQFAPVGVMWHHTVTRPTTPDAVVDAMLAINGSSKVPPPLCNYSTNRDGSISVIAAGTANHGGVGSWEGYTGNSRFFGDEMKNLGTSSEPWPKIQLEAARLAAAALLDHIGGATEMLCGHKEYALPPGRKTDPHTLNMDTERHNVEAIRDDGQEEERLLPLNPASAVEDIRWLQDLLNETYGSGITVNGVWGTDTAAPVKANLLKYTGTNDPDALAGKSVNANMWNGLHKEWVLSFAGSGGGGIPPGITFTAKTQ